MSRNMCKLYRKVCHGQNLPHESPNFTKPFFQSNFAYNLGHVSTSVRPHYKNIFFLFKYIFFSTPGCLKTYVFGVTLCNAKMGVGPTFTWSNEP